MNDSWRTVLSQHWSVWTRAVLTVEQLHFEEQQRGTRDGCSRLSIVSIPRKRRHQSCPVEGLFALGERSPAWEDAQEVSQLSRLSVIISGQRSGRCSCRNLV